MRIPYINSEGKKLDCDIIEAIPLRETDQAVLLKIGISGKKTIWIPKSQIIDKSEDPVPESNLIKYLLPVWLIESWIHRL